MIEIIPTIVTKDFDELKEKIRLVEPYVNWFQLDVMDGLFVNNETWNNPDDLSDFETNLNLEAHLMILKPESHIDKWINSGVKRITFHYGSTDKHEEIIEKVKKAGIEVGLAINPEASINVLDQFIDNLDLVLIMTVNPGFGGQTLIKETLGKIEALRRKYENVKIQVDGGVNLETAPALIKAGANMLVSGSAIFKSQNIKETIKKLTCLPAGEEGD